MAFHVDVDRGLKKALGARAGIPQYWFVNLVDMQIEVLRDVDAATGEYRQPAVFGLKDGATVIVDGKTIGALRLEELLPEKS